MTSFVLSLALDNRNSQLIFPYPNSTWLQQRERSFWRRSTRWYHPCWRASIKVCFDGLDLCGKELNTDIEFIGQLGRVAVIGGSEDYTGAPYFSAMASAKLGADMVSYLFLPSSSYHPALIFSLEPRNLRTRRRRRNQNLLPKPHGPPLHAPIQKHVLERIS